MPRSFAEIAASNVPLDPARAGVRSPRTFILDLETTGLLRGFRERMRNDIGISQIALRQEGRSGTAWSRFTDILVDPLTKVREGRLKAESLADVLEASDPLGRRWQKGFKQKGNVLHGVFERHAKATHDYLDATRGSMKNRMDALVSESHIVQKMTEHLEAGDRIKGWNVFYDLDVLSQAAARSSSAVNQRWIRAMNIARNAGQIQEMSTGVKKFMFLAAQESMMQQKIGREPFFNIKNVSYEIWQAAKMGKLTVDQVDTLSADKLLETHQGWKGFLGQRVASGKRPARFEAYQRMMLSLELWGNKAQTFATGQRYPNIEFAKGWSAAVIAETLQPGTLDRVSGISGTTLEREALKYVAAGKSMQHEAVTDTILEEMFEKLFKTESKTWGGMWDDVLPRLAPYDIKNQTQMFHRMESAIEKVSRSQVREVAMASSRQLDTTLAGAVGKKVQALGAAAGPLKEAAAHQPMTLRRIYGEAGVEISSAWRNFGKAHPRLRALALGLSIFAVADALTPEKNVIEGVRDRWSEHRGPEGIRRGPMGRGVSQALTDYGSGRDPRNLVTKKIIDVVKHRASMSVRSLERDSIYTKVQSNQALWTRVRAAGEAKPVPMPAPSPPVRPGKVGDRVLAIDAASRQTSDVYRSTVKPTSIRTLWAWPVQGPGYSEPISRVEQAYGKYGEVSHEKLREMVQSLRLLRDPMAQPGGKDVGVLVDRELSRALQVEKAARNPKRAAEIARLTAEVAAVTSPMALSSASNVPDKMHFGSALGWTYQRLLETGRRVAKEANIHRAPPVPRGRAGRHIPNIFPDRYQTGTATRATIMQAFNERVKVAGFMPGLRHPASKWNRAGFGINPSSMPFANVSQFSSGRIPTIGERIRLSAPRRLFEWSKMTALAGPRDLLAAINRSGVPLSEGTPLLDPFAHMVSEYVRYPRGTALAEALAPKKGLQYGFSSRMREPIQLMTRIARQLKSYGMESEIYDIIAAGRSEGAKELAAWGRTAGTDMKRSVLSGAWGRITDQEISKLAAQRRAEAISWGARQRHEHLLDKSLIKQARVEAQRNVLRILRAPTSFKRVPPYVSRHQTGIGPASVSGQPMGTHLPLPSNKPPNPIPPPVSPVAIKDSSKAYIEVASERAIKRSSTKGMEAWKQMGLGALATAAAAMGIWWLTKDDQDRASYTMSNAPAYRHPNEFQSMRSYGQFYSSYSEYGWTAYQAESQEALAALRSKQSFATMLGAVGVQGLFNVRTSLDQAWQYFSGKADLQEARWALQEFDTILKKRGYTGHERRSWFRRQKTAKGFVGRIQKTAPKGFLGSAWSGISSYFTGVEAKISGKAVKDGSTVKSSLRTFYDNLIVRPFARRYGKTVNEYYDLKKKGQLRQLAKLRHYSRWSEEVSAFKYLWKHLVKDASSFGAKMQGLKEMWHGAGNLERLRMAHEANLIGRLPSDLRGPQNVFTKWGRWISKQISSEGFAAKHPEVHKSLSKFAKGVGKFGQSGVGRLLSKVPVAGIVWGIADGISMMDQYHSVTKGFMVESAAGATYMAIQTVLFRPTLWVTIGAAIGSVLPGAGTALGAAIGTLVGTVATAAASLFLGHVLGEAAGGVVRSVGQTVLNARKKHHLDPAAYTPEDQVYNRGGGILGMRASGPSTFNRFHAIDAGRPELTPFGGPFNPQKGAAIDRGTLQNANRRRRSLDRRPTMIGQSGFAPTVGLVNDVLWSGRRRSRIRSSVQRGAMKQPNRPRLPVNGSRMIRAA